MVRVSQPTLGVDVCCRDLSRRGRGCAILPCDPRSGLSGTIAVNLYSNN